MILSEAEVLKTAKAVPAIYKITNTVNGKIYVGSTKHYRERRTRHFYELRHNKHQNPRLQRAFNKYGNEAFVVEILTPCTVDDLIPYEQMFIDLLHAADKAVGYNICRFAGRTDNTGWHHSEESKRKIGDANRGRVRTPEWLARLSESHKELFASGYVHPNKGKRLPAHRIEQLRSINRIPVVRIGRDGEQDVFFESLIDAERATPKAHSWCISRCCRGLALTSGGYKWKWADK